MQIKQVDGVYNIDKDGKYPAYTLNNQDVVLTCKPVTFGSFGRSVGGDEGKYFIPTTQDDYMSIYSSYISGDTYIIKT